MQPLSYQIYPSLLDQYQSLLDYEQVAEEDWNLVSEAAKSRGEYPDKEVGDYKLTPDEMYAKIEQELLDAVNRKPHEPSEAADRGTALNEIVDCLVENRKPTKEGILIQSLRDSDNRAYAIQAELNGFTFIFDYALCKELRELFEGAVPQVYTEAILPTRYGNVKLYGFIDYSLLDTVVDLKTTSRYTFGKYGSKWQRYVYPYTLIESGKVDEISTFTYLPVLLRKTMPITGDIYREDYTYDHKDATLKLVVMVESFIRWLDDHRAQITNHKIFNNDGNHC